MTLTKDETIRELVSALEVGRRGWVLVDHWEADLCAVGIANGAEPRRLVYVSTYGKAPETYDYECEVPDSAQPAENRQVARGENVSLTELVAVLERHLGRDRSAAEGTSLHGSETSGFVMDVVDIFSFDDGRTVFAGVIAEGPSYISACDCVLVVASNPVARFRIEGERIPLKRVQKHVRAVSTIEKVDVRLAQGSMGQCKLQSV
jgi:hypothetical protein